MLSYLTGDLIRCIEAGNFNVVVHGVNCFGKMGSGVAKALAVRWPSVLEADLAYGTIGDPMKLGTCSHTDVTVGRSIVRIYNAYTQFDYGRAPGVRYTEYCALATAFGRLAAHFREVAAHPVIGIPRIGCGTGGAHWRQVSDILNTVMPDFNVYVVTPPT